MAYKHKRSSVAGKVPLPADFTDGEILINTADGRAFINTPSGVKTLPNTGDILPPNTANVGAAIAAASGKQTPADSDFFSGVEAGSSTIFKTTWGNIKAALSAIFLSKSGGTMTGALIAPGLTTTDGSINIKNDGYSHLWLRNAAGAEKAGIYCNNPGENTTFRVNGTQHFSFQANGSFVAPANIAAYSDARLKSEVETISDALAIIKNLRGTRYIKGGVKQIGLIAQEVREVVPEAVFENTDENDQFIKAGHETGTLSVAADNTLLAVVIEAVKELSAEVDYLRGRLE